MKRLASTWAAASILVLAQIAGCEGQSSSDDDAGGGSGAGGGGTGSGQGGATSGSSGVGGDLGGTGPGGGRGGAAPTGGSGGGGGVSGTGAAAGQAGEGGEPGGTDGGAGGDPGEGGAGTGPVDATVHGRIVDFWLQPVPNVTVTIGTMTASTNASGEFSVPDVAPEYDVSFEVTWPGGQSGTYGWRFEGLTRRDPTLQVYKGWETQYGNIRLDPQGETLDATRTLFVAIASPYGAGRFEDVGGAGVQTSTSWAGALTANATLHALLWELDADELPVAYRSYDDTTVVLDATGATEAVAILDVADETIGIGTVSGTVTRTSASERANYAYVRFADGAAIRVVADDTGPNAYSYVLPSIPSSSITMAASTGNSYFGSYAVAHRDGLTTGQANVALEVPTPVTQVAPVTGVSNVTGSTAFSWSGTAGPYVFHAESNNFYNGAYVVTARRTITLGALSGMLRPNQPFTWRVERHGSATSVDAIAGSEGYLDAFSRVDDYPEGRRAGDGSYTISTGRGFTTQP